MASVGSFTLSHSAMYFPPPPDTNTFVENVVKVTYAEPQARSADVAVVFKVKCSAPSKFHVHPRIGAILLPRGALSSSIALHVSAKEEGSGNCSTLIARSAAPSAIGGDRNGKGPRDFQERFSVDAFLVTEPNDIAAVAEDAATILQTPSSKSQRVQSQSQKVFDKAALSAGKSPSMIPVKSAAIRVYLENVVAPGGRPSDASCVVIPPEAEVRFLPFRVPTSTRSSLTTPARQGAPGRLGDSPSSTPVPPAAASAQQESIADETRRLKEELQRLQGAIAESERDKRVLERGVAGSTSMLKKYDDAAQAQEAASADGTATAAASASKRKRGVPFVVVIGMMCLTFAISLYFRLNSDRGAITNPFGLHRSPQLRHDEM